VFLENTLGLFEKSKGVPFVPKCKQTLLIPMLVFIFCTFYGKGCYRGGGPTLFYFVDTWWGRMGMNLLFSTLIENWEIFSNS
jgi:hypothetical protein